MRKDQFKSRENGGSHRQRRVAYIRIDRNVFARVEAFRKGEQSAQDTQSKGT